jgi:uncharacterized OB-fold protein
MVKDVYAYKCQKCGHLHYPYRMVCENCGENEHNEFDPVPLPQKGVLVTFTQLHNLPPAYEVPRLKLGVVKLANGLTITGQLRIADPRLGMAVQGHVDVVRSEAYDRYYGMVFEEA